MIDTSRTAPIARSVVGPVCVTGLIALLLVAVAVSGHVDADEPPDAIQIQGQQGSAIAPSGTVVIAPGAISGVPNGVLSAAACEHGADCVINPGNNGQTLDLQVGDQFTLALSPDWVVQGVDPAVLHVRSDIVVPAGSQGVYQALQPGATVLVATRQVSLACQNTRPPCLAFPMTTFTLIVIVS